MDLTSFNEGEFFDVNLVPYGCEENPAEDLQYVAILFVEFELGERMFMEFVDRTNIVLASELNVFANTIENLHDQILQELSKKNLVISRPDDANERQMKVPDRRIGNTSPDDLRDRLSAICWSPGESRLASSQIC